MLIADNIIKERIKNVYFLWGRGKTTIANELQHKYGGYIYSTDEARERHYHSADPLHQPHMCRDYEKEYNVRSFWELPAKVILEREENWLKEFTPMVILDLMMLSAAHDIIICEGDIDYETVAPIATHCVYLLNRSTTFDWFSRPEHVHDLDSVKNRADLSAAEKEAIIRNAHAAVSANEGHLPNWAEKYGIASVSWDDDTALEQTAQEVARLFGIEQPALRNRADTFPKTLADAEQI